MTGIQSIHFVDRDYHHNTIRIVIGDDSSSYSANIDTDALVYAFEHDLGSLMDQVCINRVGELLDEYFDRNDDLRSVDHDRMVAILKALWEESA